MTCMWVSVTVSHKQHAAVFHHNSMQQRSLVDHPSLTVCLPSMVLHQMTYITFAFAILHAVKGLPALEYLLYEDMTDVLLCVMQLHRSHTC